jgi:hypothetical protein
MEVRARNGELLSLSILYNGYDQLKERGNVVDLW